MSRRLYIHASRLPACLAAIGLVFVSGCAAPQRQARSEASAQWNAVRSNVKLRLATDQLEAGSVDQAASSLAEAWQLTPNAPELTVLQARVELARGNLNAVEALLKPATLPTPLRAEACYLRGIVAQQRQQWRAAEQEYRAALADNPQDLAALVAATQCLLQLDAAQDALKLLNEHEGAFGWTSGYQAALAETCEQLGRWRDAATAWKKVLDADQPSDDVRERLALAQLRAGNPGAAAEQLEKLIAGGRDDDAALLLALGEARLATGRPNDAVEAATAVLRRDEANFRALQLLTQARAAQGRFELALQTGRRLLAQHPRDLATVELVAALAYRAGDDTLARRLAHQLAEGQNAVAERLLALLDAPDPSGAAR